MKVVVIIPSRYGSTRFEGKPLALIKGVPMIQRVYENCSRAKNLDGVYVATDDARIYRAVTGFGGRAVMTSSASRSGTDRTAEAADILGLLDDTIVVNVQGDQPLVHPRSIEDVVRPFLEEDGLLMSTLAFRILDEREKTDPKDVKVTFDEKGYALYFSRAPIPAARDAGMVYDMYKHLGVYAYRLSFLKTFAALPEGRLERIERLEQLRALEYGYRIRVAVTAWDSPEVDIEEDISRIERAIG